MPPAGIAITVDCEASEHSANAAEPAPRQIKDLDFIVVLPFDGMIGASVLLTLNLQSHCILTC